MGSKCQHGGCYYQLPCPQHLNCCQQYWCCQIKAIEVNFAHTFNNINTMQLPFLSFSHCTMKTLHPTLQDHKSYYCQHLHPTTSRNDLAIEKLAHNHALQIMGDGVKYCKSARMLVWQSWKTTHQVVYWSKCTTFEWKKWQSMLIWGYSMMFDTSCMYYSSTIS